MEAKKPIHCFLARGKDAKPISANVSKDWTKHITKELLKKKSNKELYFDSNHRKCSRR
jgi:hypothetical protein